MKMTYLPVDANLYPLLCASKTNIANRHPLSLRRMESLLEICTAKNIEVASPSFIVEKGRTSVLSYKCPGCAKARTTPISNVFEKLNIGKLPICPSCAQTKRKISILKKATPEIARKKSSPPLGKTFEMDLYPFLKKMDVNTNDFRKTSLPHMEQVLASLNEKEIEPLFPVFTKSVPSGNSFVNYTCPDCAKPARSMVSGFFKKKFFACHSCSAKAINKDNKTIDVSDIRDQIEDKGFKIVHFEHFTKTDSAWTVECAHGHSFTSSANQLLKELSFCPQCNNLSIEQELMRGLVESHYNAKFPTVRPDWMQSPVTGLNLELDLFNADLNIAFEYHGPQHFLPIYGAERLAVSARNDKLKREICAKNGVTLFEIHYVDPNTKSEISFLELIAESLRNHGIPIDSKLPSQLCGTIDLNRPFATEMMEKAQAELSKQNKTLVACRYVNSESLLTTRCNACGHSQEQTIKALIYNKHCSKGCNVCWHLRRRSNTEKKYSTLAKAICAKEGWLFESLHCDSANVIVGFAYHENEQAFLDKRSSKVSRKSLSNLMAKHCLKL